MNGDTAVQILINPSQLNRYTLVLFARTSVGLNVCIFVRASCLTTCRFSLTEKGTGKKMKKKGSLGVNSPGLSNFHSLQSQAIRAGQNKPRTEDRTELIENQNRKSSVSVRFQDMRNRSLHVFSVLELGSRRTEILAHLGPI